jgi:hypothetical protein
MPLFEYYTPVKNALFFLRLQDCEAFNSSDRIMTSSA